MKSETALRLRKVLAAKLIFYRHTKHLSQEHFAEICGFHRTYVGSVERAERNVTLATLAKFASALNVSVADLLTEGENSHAR